MNALQYLKEVASKTSNTNKTVLLPIGQMRFGCPNHRDVKGRKYTESIVFVNARDFEIECTCGTIYRRSRDYVPSQESRIIT